MAEHAHIGLLQAATVGIVVNAAAGDGHADLRGVAGILENLGTVRVVGERRGLDRLGDATAARETVAVAPAGAEGAAATRTLVRRLVARGVQAIIAVGGDGTISDTATELSLLCANLPVVGIGVGTINVGALVTCRADDLASRRYSGLRTFWQDALEAASDDGRWALAFNDVTAATTIIGTGEHGELCDFEATKFLAGRRLAARSRSIASASAVVTLRNADGEWTFARGSEIGCVVVGLLDERYFGKAVAGGACVATSEGYRAGCVVSDVPIVCASGDEDGTFPVPRVRSIFCGLGDDDEIVVSSCADGAVLSADGNPIAPLGTGRTAVVRLRRAAVTGVSLGSVNR